jgi:hypothetical protein
MMLLLPVALTRVTVLGRSAGILIVVGHGFDGVEVDIK